jgi:hypothetical protein
VVHEDLSACRILKTVGLRHLACVLVTLLGWTLKDVQISHIHSKKKEAAFCLNRSSELQTTITRPSLSSDRWRHLLSGVLRLEGPQIALLGPGICRARGRRASGQDVAAHYNGAILFRWFERARNSRLASE